MPMEPKINGHEGCPIKNNNNKLCVLRIPSLFKGYGTTYWQKLNGLTYNPPTTDTKKKKRKKHEHD